jgi:hypothetical protein
MIQTLREDMKKWEIKGIMEEGDDDPDAGLTRTVIHFQ